MFREDDSKATLRQVQERSALHFRVHVMSSWGRLITDQFAGSDLIRIGAFYFLFFSAFLHSAYFCLFSWESKKQILLLCANANLNSLVLVINSTAHKSFLLDGFHNSAGFLAISRPPEMFCGLEILIAFGIWEVKPRAARPQAQTCQLDNSCS